MSEHLVGQFNLPISCLRYAHHSRAVRDICPNHLKDLLKSFESQHLNGYAIQFPEANGFFLDDETDTDDLLSGKHQIELIDGNHTHNVMIQLAEKYPEEASFKFR